MAVTDGRFEWDDVKAEANHAKHGVTFSDAASAFDDPNGVYVDDGAREGVTVLVGFSTSARLLTVVHVEIEDDRIRIISARRATNGEAALYDEGN